jgi:hypothetical protein
MTTRQDLANEIFTFYDDPLGFVLFSFPWGVKGTPLEDFPDGPDSWAREEFLALATHVRSNIDRAAMGEKMQPYLSAIASGHGIGKSCFIAWIIIWIMSTRRYARGIVTANTQNQLEGKTWAELSKWWNLSINKDWFKYSATKFYCILESDGEKNWMFECVPWSEDRPESFAGLHNAGSAVVNIYDEASAIADKIWQVSEGAMTDGEPFWFAFGNPTKNTGRFRECFGKYRHRWRNRHIDSRTVKITNKEQIDKWIEDHGLDSDFVKVRVRGLFPSSGDKQFIAVSTVEEAQVRDLEPDRGASLVMGVDLSRGGAANNVIRFRCGRDARTIKAIRWQSADTMFTANRIAEEIDRWNPDAVFMDGGGVGGPIIDRLRSRNYKVIEVAFGTPATDDQRFANKRAEMWQRMKDWLSTGCIDDSMELRDDLIGLEKGWDSRDRLLLESKDKMAARGLASPDDGDALALTFSQSIGRRDLSGSATRSRGRMAEGVDYLNGSW